jgi:putative FmdB family regulatory protein
MPLYDFHCEACGSTFEELTRADAPAPPCPACGSADVQRKLGSFAGPFTIGLRGGEARRSNAVRKAREERRQEGFARQREERRQNGGAP